MCAVYIAFVLFTLDSHSVAVTGEHSTRIDKVVRKLHFLGDREVSAIVERHPCSHMLAFDVYRPSSRS
jgi:hypothetical protein